MARTVLAAGQRRPFGLACSAEECLRFDEPAVAEPVVDDRCRDLQRPRLSHRPSTRNHSDGGRNAQTVRRGSWTRPATDPCRARAHRRQICALAVRPAALGGPPGGEGGPGNSCSDLRPSVKRECDHVRSPVPQQAARVRDARADMQRRIEAVGDVELDLARRHDRYAEALGQNCGLGPWR